MAGIPKVKITFDADFDELKKGVKGATDEVQSFSDKAADFGKKAALAFAVAGAAAIKFGLDFAKMAADDAAAQEKLDATIKATTDSTDAQVAAVGEWITKTSIAIGVPDDALRPAFSRLVRSTKDTEEAQKLLNLAMDLSSASGKPLETTTNALAKAYDGNFAALNKLGFGIDDAKLKAKDFDGITKELAATYGSFAENEAETAAKKFERIKIATDEAKEAIGAALLPVIEKISDYLLTTFIPNLTSLIDGLTGKGSLTEATENSTDGAYKWGVQIGKILKKVVEFKDELIVVTGVIAGVFVVSKISAAVTATIGLITTLIKAYNALKASALVAGIASAFALNPLLGVGAVALAAGVLAAANKFIGNGDTDTSALTAPSTGAFADTIKAAGGYFGSQTPTVPTVTGGGGGSSGGAGGSSVVKAVAAAAVAPATNAVIGSFNAGSFRMAEAASTGTGDTINITITGAYDKEGAAREIVDLLNYSSARGGGGFQSLMQVV